MSTRLDASHEMRLRRLATSLRLSASTVDDALAVHKNDVRSAEMMLRNLALAPNLRSSSAQPLLTREQRMRKCAAALARQPAALDLLYMSLTKVAESPLNERLRKVNIAAFKARIQNPAGIELLHTAGYEPMHGFLVLQKLDPVMIGAAIAALADSRSSTSYIDAKAELDGAQARRMAAEQDAAAAAAKRAAALAKVPAEPKPGDDRESSSCVITVSVAGASDAPAARTTRRFDSDNTLTDLFNFIQSLPGTPVDAFTVENTTTRPVRVLDPVAQAQMSLYALDLWPRGQVKVR